MIASSVTILYYLCIFLYSALYPCVPISVYTSLNDVLIELSCTGRRHVLGLPFSKTRVNTSGHDPVLRSRYSRRLSSHERLRLSHVQARQRQQRDNLLQIPLQGSFFYSLYIFFFFIFRSFSSGVSIIL